MANLEKLQFYSGVNYLKAYKDVEGSFTFIGGETESYYVDIPHDLGYPPLTSLAGTIDDDLTYWSDPWNRVYLEVTNLPYEPLSENMLRWVAYSGNTSVRVTASQKYPNTYIL